MKIYLIRHGQSEGNVRNLWYGITDLPLTDLGRQQAAQVGEKLRDLGWDAAGTEVPGMEHNWRFFSHALEEGIKALL